MWLPVDFAHPVRVELPTRHHLRPISERDTPIDYPAVMASRARLWEKYGDVWGWPPTTLTYEQDREELARHEGENQTHEAFVYALLNGPETELLGCLYIDPPDDSSPPGTDAVVSWWVIDQMVGTELESALDDFVPRWLSETWGFESVHFFP
jgi:hypothetical protein